LIEDQTGGTMPPAEAAAEAPTSEERVATMAVADEPADTSEPASEPAADAAPIETEPTPEAVAEATPPDTAPDVTPEPETVPAEAIAEPVVEPEAAAAESAAEPEGAAAEPEAAPVEENKSGHVLAIDNAVELRVKNAPMFSKELANVLPVDPTENALTPPFTWKSRKFAVEAEAEFTPNAVPAVENVVGADAPEFR